MFVLGGGVPKTLLVYARNVVRAGRRWTEVELEVPIVVVMAWCMVVAMDFGVGGWDSGVLERMRCCGCALHTHVNYV